MGRCAPRVLSPDILPYSPEGMRCEGRGMWHSPEKMLQPASCACFEALRMPHSLACERYFAGRMPPGKAFAASDERGMRLDRSFAPQSLWPAGYEGEEMGREGQGMRFAERFLPLRRAL